ncbi:MAG: gluconate 2-dehydrogenase subunit 3 family protein [Acidobacteria bacterium]|nr:gluconate 2-dehydrogenase subunit 3 family protein [Acidobacteriota bacterium]
MSDSISRREWTLATLGLATPAELAQAWQHAHEAAAAPPAKLNVLDPEMAREIEALTSRIIPSDGSPGAREAGVIYFIDRALGGWQSEHLPAYRRGMTEVQALRTRMFPNSSSIAALSEADQDRLIAAFDQTPFFSLLRTHTAFGFLGSPAYGGNRGGAGWAHIGFEDRASFSPPFGYYDAQALREGGK